ncbi:hypothetical protein L1D34_14420 [Vibrio mediterranei]|uniref:hypothetical protein n=1 Tax=Vibrio TaxID=662 RepID=UPI001EFEBC8E|nr:MULTISPECIES: hypothetical protein [Vibrio]MCG9626032.1 hypothetical protein [Vibrio mediterranei]MDG3086884.1 hypothetical protein [Vibrio hannami]
MEAVELEAIREVADVSPERQLFVEVILLAVVESLGGEGRKKVKQDDQERAQFWLERSPICKEYCELVDLDYTAMIERLRPHWRQYAKP